MLTQLEMRETYLSKELEYELACRWRDHKDQNAMDRLVNSHHRFVRNVVRPIARSYPMIPVEDLVQQGNLGLVTAVHKFDPDNGNRFSTYAMWWVKAMIYEYIMNNWTSVRLGTSSEFRTLFFGVKRIYAQMAGGVEKRPKEVAFQELADRVGVKLEMVEFVEQRLINRDVSMQAPVKNTEGASTVEDTFVDDTPSPEENVIVRLDAERAAQRVRGAMRHLKERERIIIEERHLRKDEEKATLECLGEKFGVSKERVRQIEVRAMEKLHRALLRPPVTLRRQAA